MSFDIVELNNCYNRILIHNKRLIDDDILILLQLFVEKSTIVDSQLTSLIMNNYINNKENKKGTLDAFLTYFKSNDIIIIPLFYKSHWSLILYIKLYDTILYFDSITNYHKSYVNKFYEFLITQSIIINNKTNIDTVSQNSDWECGYYVIIYVNIATRLYQYKHLYGKDQYIIYLNLLVKRDLKLDIFIQLLIQMLSIGIKREEYHVIK